MSDLEVRHQGAELMGYFEGMNRADRAGVLAFARLRAAKNQRARAAAPGIGDNEETFGLFVASVRNDRARAVFFYSHGGKIQ